jgi:CelD/BcsL family acetyltransferase involved in cellulose biosynthesis
MEIAGLSWLCEPLSDTSKLERLWTELCDRSDCSFFLTWDWIGSWLSEMPNPSPLLLSVYDGPTVVALALFQPTSIHRAFGQARALMLHQSGDPSADLITIEYNGILTDRRYTQHVESGLFSFLTKAGIFGHGRKHWQEIHVALATATLSDIARQVGLITTERVRMPSWFVDLNLVRAGGKHYLDNLSPNTRQQIRRSMRMYEQRGPIKATPAHTVDEALEFLDELKSLHQETWTYRGKPGSFASSHFERFHRTLIRRCVERGSVEIIRVTAGDHLIGQVYNFICRGRVYAYQTGLFYETEPKLKPGLICHCICIERHLATSASIYDFMAGSARYKANLGIRGPDLAHYVIEPKTLRSQSLALARYMKRRLNNL